MLAFLEGKIAFLAPESVVIDVGGVGYRVMITRDVGEMGASVRLWLGEVIREDRHDLFGFLTRDELALFEKLISIDGVGPKMAQKILAAGKLDEVLNHMHAGDLGFLTSISGVGKKTAQKIILELRGTIVNEANVPEDEVGEALLSLGYSRSDIERVLGSVRGETSEERLRSALQMLGKR